MFSKLLTSLETGLARLLGRVWMLYYHIRLRRLMYFLKSPESAFIGASCPHEVRIPMEIVRRLNKHERRMLENAMLYSARPYGAIVHQCRRCYCLTRSTIRENYLGY